MQKNAPRVMFNFMEDDVPESNITMEIEDEDDAEGKVDTLDVPEPVNLKEEVNEENIFENNIAVLPDKVREDIDLEMAEQGTTLQKENKKQKQIVKEVKKTKTGKTRKPMSAEHKEKLKYAREKALESRKQKQKERAEQKKFEAEEKELLKKKKVKDFEKLKREVNDDEPPSSVKPPIVQQTFTKKDLEEAQLDAIIKYEAIRKERKAKKKEEQLITQQREQMKAKINNYGSRTNGKLNNRFDICY